MKFQFLGYEIVFRKQNKKTEVSKKRPYHRWTNRETVQLKDLLERGFTISDISVMMNRPYSTLQKKIKGLQHAKD